MAKTKDANFKVLSMTTRIHEDKTLIKHISCDFKCKFNSAPFNSNQYWNIHKCQCECKKYRLCKKDCSWNLNICICGVFKKFCS